MYFHKNGNGEASTQCAFLHVDREGARAPRKPRQTKVRKKENESNSTALQVSSYVTGEPGPTSSAAVHSPRRKIMDAAQSIVQFKKKERTESRVTSNTSQPRPITRTNRR